MLEADAAVIIDAHVHVFPPRLIDKRESLVRQPGAFGALYSDPDSPMATADELIAVMDEDGVSKAVVCGFPWSDVGVTKEHNEYILDAARRFPDRIIPLASVDPLAPGAVDEASRALSAGAAGLGEIGVYTHDLGEPEVLAAMAPLCELCADARRPLLLHANEPIGHDYPGKSPMTLRGLYELIRQHRKTRFQLAHLGGGMFLFELLKKEVCSTLCGCAFDLAAAPFLYKPSLYPTFISLAGPDRLLYGSDFPLLRLSRYRKHLERGGLDDETVGKILGENAAAFWYSNPTCTG